MKRLLPILLAVVLCVGIVVAGCGQEPEPAPAPAPSPSPAPSPAPAPAPEPEPKPLIKVSDLNWGSAHFQAEIAKIIIEEGYGYPVELVAGKTVNLWQALRINEVDVYMEAWTANMVEIIEPALAAGDVVEMGVSNNDNWQSLYVVPTYVIKGDTARGIELMAPNLKSVFDLDQPQYKELFKDPEDPGKGRIPSCLPGWQCELINQEQLEAYGLADDYNLINPGSQEALFAGLMAAYEKGEPYITYLWGPTWIAGKLDLTLLEEPPHDEAVWEENKGCAYPSSPIVIFAYKDFSSKAPELAEMFPKWKMDTKTLGEGLAYMDDTGGEPIDAAIWFLKEREDLWTGFVPADVAQKVKAAVAGM